jgi:hypothetical protein
VQGTTPATSQLLPPPFVAPPTLLLPARIQPAVATRPDSFQPHHRPTLRSCPLAILASRYLPPPSAAASWQRSTRTAFHGTRHCRAQPQRGTLTAAVLAARLRVLHPCLTTPPGRSAAPSPTTTVTASPGWVCAPTTLHRGRVPSSHRARLACHHSPPRRRPPVEASRRRLPSTTRPRAARPVLSLRDATASCRSTPPSPILPAHEPSR